MRIMIVDDEPVAVKKLSDCVREISQEAEIVSFMWSDDALAYEKENDVDVAFLDIQMPVMSGIDLAKELKKTHPLLNVIFCTAYAEFMSDAIRMHASGYVTKPYKKEDIARELDNLLHPVEKEMPKVFIRTFGMFDILVDGVAVNFKRQKAKEMLAYMIDKRGGVVNKKDLAAALFEDDYSLKTQDYLKKIYKYLQETLKEYKVDSILVKGFNQYSLDNTKFSCDLYDYDKGLPEAINAYKGEYMAQYEWAIF